MTTDPEATAEAKPANEVTTDPTSAASSCEPYRDLIEQGKKTGRNAVGIWQELVDQHGFPGAYESVKRFVRKQRGTQNVEARAVIITEAGEDYGECRVMVRRGRHLGRLRTYRRSSFGSHFP